MFKKNGKFHADWRDCSGHRLRKSFTDTQSIPLLAYREKQSQRVIAQITGWCLRALSYKLPAALADLVRVLDRADLL